MSLSSPFGARPTVTPTPPVTVQGGVRTPAAQTLPASGKIAAPLPTVDPIGPQGDVVSISREGLRTDGATLARSTGENAQSFMNTFAQRLFGETASTTSVAYNLKPSPLSAAGDGASAASAVVRAAAFDLTEPARFTGTGQIMTDDGRSFDFAVKVKYEPRSEPADALLPRNGAATVETPDVLMLTGKPLPEIQFPGSLDDLYKLLSRELRTEVSSGAGDGAPLARSGELTLRLERLVDRAALLAPRARPDDPGISATERAKAVAQSYASAAAGNEPSRA